MQNDNTSEPLLIDRSLPEPVSDAEVRSWMATQTGFVSSVMSGMTQEREAAAEAVEQLDGKVVLFERLGGRDDDAETAYLDGVRASDIYLGVLGTRYGIPDRETGFAPTEAEYNEAVHHGLRISVWATTDPMDGRQRDFLRTVQVFNTTGNYSSPEELRERIEERLRGLAAEAGSPWCKVGSTAFRARRIRDTGNRIVVEASVRNQDVVARLEALRPCEWSRHPETRITWGGRSSAVTVDAVTLESMAGRARHIKIEASRSSHGTPSWTSDIAYEGRSPEDMTELAVRVALLGEPNPLGTMAFLADMPNPLSALRGLQLGEDAVPALAELLVTEALVGSGRAERVTTVRVGPKHMGRRRALIEWLPPRRYSNVAPEPRSVHGEIPA
jgi:hypothetical protein